MSSPSTSSVDAQSASAAKSSSSKKGKQSTLEYLVSGGIAGAVSRTCIAPIERVKIIYQINHNAQMSGYLQLWPELVRKEGFRSLWKGNSVAVLRVVPYMSITFTAFEKYKQLLLDQQSRFSFIPAASYASAVDFASGSLAGATAVLLTYPLDFARAQLAMQANSPSSHLTARYKGPFDVLINHPKKYGFFSLYRGLGPTIMGGIPYAGLKFGLYEGIKRILRNHWNIEEADLPSWARMACGGTAAAFAQTTIYPLDIIRRRMQTADGATRRYTSSWDGLVQITKQEGVRRGLFRGLSLNLTKVCSLP